jgi:ABC-type multidrug transport system ATPase subunit
MDTEFVLQTHHLKKQFGSALVVDDVSLEIRPAEIFGFLGPNGAGKTTTISMILGLTYATAGEIKVFDEIVTPEHTHALRRVGTMVGAPALMLSFSASRNLQTLAHLYPDLPTTRIDEVLEQVDLQTTGNLPARKFSTGMKQRLGLALALLNKPDLLILDEPTNGMDPAGIQEIRVLLRSLSEQGTTIFLSSHLLHEMEQICDRVAVIQKGQIIAQGKTAELLPKHDIVLIRTTHPEQTAQALQDLPGAKHIKQNDVSIEVQNVASEQILSFLLTRGLIPSEVAVSHPDLESVFLELTQRTT